jgi:hypothetical protein
LRLNVRRATRRTWRHFLRRFWDRMEAPTMHLWFDLMPLHFYFSEFLERSEGKKDERNSF